MKYDVYGIGNALVDIVTEVGEDFFIQNNIQKGVMTLVDEKRQHELIGAIDMTRSKMSCGGSAGNTVIAVSQFGGKSFYSCLVAKDDLGRFFLKDLERNGVSTNLRAEACPEGLSGRCLVMTTPDADRTMNTFLGISYMLRQSTSIKMPSVIQTTFIWKATWWPVQKVPMQCWRPNRSLSQAVAKFPSPCQIQTWSNFSGKNLWKLLGQASTFYSVMRRRP